MEREPDTSATSPSYRLKRGKQMSSHGPTRRVMKNSSGRVARAGGPALHFILVPQKWVPRSCVLCKGGNHELMRKGGFVSSDKGCVGIVATRPCKQRKDGAPAALVMPTGSKAGPPADSFPGTPCLASFARHGSPESRPRVLGESTMQLACWPPQQASPHVP
jgi:hypothetical protein